MARAEHRRQLPGWPVKTIARIVAGALVAAALPGAGIVRAESFAAFTPAARGSGFEESFEQALEDARDPAEISFDLGEAARAGAMAAAGEPDTAAPAAPKKPKTFWIGFASFITVAGSAVNSFGDGRNQKFHFTNEGWFGQYTYAGGGDKASHFVSYYIVGRLAGAVNEELGMPKDSAYVLGAGVSALAGLVTELGDGRGKYGFSYEDLIMDTLGAATSVAIIHYGLDDLIGFRAGLVPAPTAVCCPYGGTGKDYTEEIYTGDLKIAGLGKRAHFNPGFGRFFMVSVSYGSKGYPYSNPVIRERQVGFEIGPNFDEILQAIGVPKDKWWGKILYFGFDVIRLPYTQIGMYYDMNNGKWHGPGIGDSFPGGP
jgi:uncharacterized protein YfiM (DUF2279 family)